MKNIVLFGAGQFAINAIKIIGADRIKYIVDNDAQKAGNELLGINILGFEQKKQELNECTIVISVSARYEKEIEEQLNSEGILNYRNLNQFRIELIKEKIENRPDYLGIYHRAIEWIHNNTVDGHAIICHSDKRQGYPEVTGYYIPSLLRWGYRELACNYADWLIGIQKEDGSWYDTDDIAPYIFDSGQILKGLIAIRPIYKEKERLDAAIIKGCDWIFSCMTESGQLVTPSKEAWGADENTCSEVIHIYCLSPLIEAGKIFDRPDYIDKANIIFEYYKKHYYEKIMNFSLLSHFYAYLMEGLVDLGELDMAREAMRKMKDYQKESGAVAAYHNVDWVCSTGLFQLAIVWFRLEDISAGNIAFEYACKLQNASGGWFGSYISEENPNETNTYIPASEISWAVKYFLDALYYKNLCEFEKQSENFLMEISREDGRYRIVEENMTVLGGGVSVLDVGCGKGRYLKNLKAIRPENKYFAADISKKVMRYIDDKEIEIRQGTLTCIPFPDNYFDMVYTCEALEHAVDIACAIKEMARVTKSRGKLVIIDKNCNQYGRLMIEDWEQWFDENELKDMLMEYCSDVRIVNQIGYDGNAADGLFLAWIGTVKG